ncbi:nicotinate (nicotinamide) nucleotide adenylyltransferase [Paludicola sp. MB14-C6]|uniref:nicotinate (nicotinamide) nucleotide adenylyltransferase n=1 Tax=Paludihabitans sp. MB14-C6 TaxID=3070656 RepID=UPI0027DC3CA5|nr:nicotinate (nicotinamide) nucleotide adenylyltransferase [Paludicola sp. MB14-C6]WMJ23679.1 nicotinate (nicotinamide) nucleotide adenylyltransferase [Paludicola sp. MB14-C6]
MKKIAIFGGTFNPVHNGHLHLCNEMQLRFHFDKILLIPTNIPPHKKCMNLASNEERYTMLQLATNGNPLYEISDIEFRLKGKSYTYNTIQALKKDYHDCEFYLLIGSDMLKIFDQWYRYQDILKEVTVIVGAREQSEYQELIKMKKDKFQETDKLQIIDISVLPKSSTEIREAIQNKLDLSNSLSPSVLAYIQSHNLYQ